jgi:adenylate cyclase
MASSVSLLDHQRGLAAISSTAIAEELERVLSSNSFRRSPRLRKLLEFVVSKAVRADSVTERVIAGQAFGRGSDFDPALDPTVRVQFGRLRRRLESYFAGEGAGDPIQIHIPERSYTPWFDHMVASASSLAPAAMPIRENGEQRPGTPGDGHASLAVMPFLNLTNDPAKDVFCFGLTDELISALASVPTVDVVARSSAFQYRNEQVDVRSVGRELGVEMILEGSVKTDAEKTRVTAQLARARDGFALWAEVFDTGNESGDELRSQEEIANHIVSALPIPPQP